jgi:hypothetical protein
MNGGDATWGQLPTTRASNAALIVLSAGAALCIGCTIEVRPLGYKPPVKKVATKKHTTHHRKAASEDTMYVSQAWLHEYHEMEAEHGGYTIADDRKIQQDGDKVKVPRTVLRHFHDLSKTPRQEETNE